MYLKFLTIYKKRDKKKKSYARNFSSGISPLAESIFIRDNMITYDTHVVYYYKFKKKIEMLHQI